NTTDPEVAARAAAKIGRAPEIIEVDTCRVDTLLRRHGHDLPFELLLIDSEGAEMDVLQSVDLCLNRPRIILLEAHDLDVKSLATADLVVMLQRHGYSLFSWINPNLLFLRDGE
ncbi:MAG: FkbM family methyltransferase, partial [Acetobacteraceae bacterium]|nr:FkbM family methyltransferase [Acetobacteraceae bacterium]